VEIKKHKVTKIRLAIYHGPLPRKRTGNNPPAAISVFE